ncbi:hypothetical protein ACFQ3N_05000 [Virgibacillus byunsanensis]|uniref:Group-specific protein n=1 Tax=Virgibacillus byunsanensis TaxID=570945 RepID=A0ABW3LIV0_9BACI
MGTCNIDHSHEDVVKKLESQEKFLPVNLTKQLETFLREEHSQKTLNELFHLFKKYDLASKTEQEDRNKQLENLIS